jgi:hypothetical protein
MEWLVNIMNKKKISYFQEFFSPDLFKELQELAVSEITDPFSSISRTNAVWHKDIVRSSMPVLVKDIENEELHSKLKSEIDAKTGKISENIMIYYWTRLSYIPWHDDNHAESALTVYLNETWDKDWGGYFMFEGGQNFQNTESNIGVIKPSRNCAVLQEGHVLHSTTTTNLDAEIRMTIQCFFKT